MFETLHDYYVAKPPQRKEDAPIINYVPATSDRAADGAVAATKENSKVPTDSLQTKSKMTQPPPDPDAIDVDVRRRYIPVLLTQSNINLT
jgi:hypothetical protein